MPMATMAVMDQHDEPAMGTADDHRHETTGHCMDTSQQCHPATPDNGSTSAPFGDFAVKATISPPVTPTCSGRFDQPAARPPDIHQLCVNRT